MRPKGTSAELERRRRRAVELVAEGESPTTVARILGVRTASVHRWRRMARKPHGLDAKPVPGRPPQLSDYHLHKLERLLLQGAKKQGSLGYSVTAKSDQFDGLELRSFNWQVQPLAVCKVKSSFFEDRALFPAGSVEFDCALLMRGIEHEWYGKGQIVHRNCACLRNDQPMIAPKRLPRIAPTSRPKSI